MCCALVVNPNNLEPLLEQWDHKHYRSVVSDDEFDSAGQLIEDFWNLVGQVLTEEGIS